MSVFGLNLLGSILKSISLRRSGSRLRGHAAVVVLAVFCLVLPVRHALAQTGQAVLGPQYVITTDDLGSSECFRITAQEFQQNFGFAVDRMKSQSLLKSEEPNVLGTAAFEISYTGFSPEAAAAFQHAADIWAANIQSPVPIRIDAVYAPLGPGILGSAGATYIISDVPNEPVPSTWYASALADQLVGSDVVVGEMDITATLNSDFSSWYFGTDESPGFGEYDFVSVVLHEIAHGLGFFDTFDVNGVGSWGISGLPAVYDAYLEDLAGAFLLDTGTYPNPSTALGTALTNDAVFFEGPMTPRSPLYAPSPFEPGSSIAHLDESTFPAGTENSLMTPALSNGEAVHEPGPITLAIFQDIGWAIANSTANCGFSCDGDGNVGIGVADPERQLHLRGSNAVFRMDRSSDTAAFMLVRTDGGGAPLKTFVLGTNASGPGQGEFILNDLGQAVGGPGVRRMTITNTGHAIFTGQVTATGFFQSSSRDYKTDIETLEGSSDKVQQLRGVEFNWKETGERSIGLIAEEVAEVLPQSVAWKKDGKHAVGVNYGSLVGLLVEATKEQRNKIDGQTREIERLQEQNQSLAERRAAIESMLERR